MPSFAITGVIGSGKSFILKKLAAMLNAVLFSADEENTRLLDSDQRVKEEIISRLGSSCYRPDGSPDREHLFQLIHRDREARHTLEMIMHPRIEDSWKPLSQKHRYPEDSFFLAEIPLLYEKKKESFFDKTIVVGSSVSIREKRLAEGRGIKSSRSREWSALQQFQDEKATRADLLLWNDGSEELLDRQARHISAMMARSS